MSAPRRERDETRVFKRMGDALGWDRTSSQGVQRAHRTADKDAVGKGYYAKDAFTPGAGHVDDGVPHRGWLGIGGSRG